VIWLSADSEKSGKGLVKDKSGVFSRDYLARLKRKAWRKGCWFRNLKQNERMLLDLTIRVVEKVRSFILAKLVSKIVDKLCRALESRVCRLIRSEGRLMAEGLSKIAQSWGYRAAKSWVDDRGFMQYLTVSNLSSLES
jgi:hypothetical protein